MLYLKNLIKSIMPVIKYMVLSYLIIFISFYIYNLLGNTDVNKFLLNYATYILVVFNIFYIYYLIRKYKVKCSKSKNIFPLFMLGISFSSFFNMIIISINKNDIVSMNLLFLILSSVIVGPIVEEILFRYILNDELSNFNSNTLTIVISSLIFALMHNGIINIVYTFLLGLVLNYIYYKDNNLTNTIIIHSSANLISLFLTDYNTYILIISFISLIISILILRNSYKRI